MKKNHKSLIAIIATIIGFNINAQVSIYSFSQFAGTYAAVTGGTVFGTATSNNQRFVDPAVPNGGTTDVGVGIPIGFNFVYNQVAYNRFAISTNGWISLGNSAFTPDPVNIQSGNINNFLSANSTAPPALQSRIGAVGANLQGQTGSQIRAVTLGAAPNRTLVVQWSGYRYNGNTGDNLNFQIRLSETTNIINLVYGTMVVNTAETAQIGLRGTSSADFNNRDVATSNQWATSIAGIANNSQVNFSSTLFPVSGQNYQWTPPPACSGTPAANLAVSNVTSVCSGASANLSLAATYTAWGLTYQWYVSTNGIGGPYNAITGGTTAAYTASNITTASYFQAVVTCTNGMGATTITPVQVIINTNPCECNTYCASAPSNTGDDEIFNVSISNLNNTSNCSQTGGPTSTLSLYANYTGIIAPANLITGATYPLNVTVGQCDGTAYDGIVSAFIDFNGNGLFTDPGEDVFVSTYTTFAVSGTQVSTLITIPSNAIGGIKRMRVIATEDFAPEPSCTSINYGYGETEDYCVNIIVATPCAGAPPANSAVTSVTSVCAGGSAILNPATTYSLSGLTYQWYVSTNGIGGPYIAVSGATASAFTATNITVNSYYTAVVTCSAGPASTTLTPVAVNININPCLCNSYCASEPFDYADDEIFNVSIGTLNNTSNCSQTGGPGSIQNIYSNYTGMMAAPNLTVGANYTLNVTGGQCDGSAYSGIVSAYIDYNHNGIFTDPGEDVYVSPYTLFAVSGTQVSTVITIPSNATTGITRLRVILTEDTSPETPCTSFNYGYGETEDYCVNISSTGCTSVNGGTLSVSALTTCANGTLALATTGASIGTGITYQWQVSATPSGPYTNVVGGTGATTTSYTTAPLTAGIYYYVLQTTCTNASLSAVSNEGTVTVGAIPNIILGTSQMSVCAGSSVSIGATGANTYTWSTGANGAAITETVNATTNYSVTGTSTAGCTSTASVTITSFTLPVVTVSSSATLICSGQTVNLTAGGANSYSWSTNATTTVIAVSPTVTTSYSVTGTTNGCSTSTTISQAVSPCTGINSVITTGTGILVYPNPNYGEFTIELNNGSVKNIQVMDLTGRIILSDSSANDKVNFNINNLANGVYYVRIQSNNAVDVIKIVKQ